MESARVSPERLCVDGMESPKAVAAPTRTTLLVLPACGAVHRMSRTAETDLLVSPALGGGGSWVVSGLSVHGWPSKGGC